LTAARGNGKDNKMSVCAGAHGKVSACIRQAIRFCRDRRGVAAIEFAFIAPLLLAMYFVTMEVSQGIETSKKVSRIGSMVADLVAQQQNVTPASLKAIMQIGQATLQPYSRSEPTIIITEIEITGDTPPTAKVSWSRRLVKGQDSAGEAKETETTVPDALKIPGTHIVRVQSSLEYKPVIAWAAESDERPLGLSSAFSNISMSETYYLRPRMSTSVACATC
jgi:Flp pilus assembly protein TadG